MILFELIYCALRNYHSQFLILSSQAYDHVSVLHLLYVELDQKYPEDLLFFLFQRQFIVPVNVKVTTNYNVLFFS